MQTLPRDRQKKLAPTKASSPSTRRALAAAFASFTQTAGALETTYTKLQAEVGRLRLELEHKNRSLAQSLEETQRMRAYLTRIVEGLPCGVLVFDREMNPRMINPAAGHLLDGDGEEGAGSELSVPPLLGSLLAALPRTEFEHEQEWVLTGAQGERTLGVTRASLPAPGADGDSILILRDLTEAKQLERAQEVSRHNQALAEVATLLAHEIRNPLGSLELFAGLLADALKGQVELQPWIDHVQAGLRSLAATVNNVLHFHSQAPTQLFPVDLVRLLGETVEFLRPLAQQKAMKIAWESSAGTVPVLADPSRLQQAFLNLALNAFRAMQPGGTLTVSAIRTQVGPCPAVTLSFADQGAGIARQNLEKIFEAGFTTRSGSPGLGLAVTRKVIEQHGGTITVESEVGRGTMFKIMLPLAEQSSDPMTGRS